MNDQDIRWHQRLRNYNKALEQLKEAIALMQIRALSNLERQGLIKSFEFTHELAWNVMKDFFEHQGTTGIMGSRDAAREAFQKGLVSNGLVWMEMIKSRNQSSHTYNDGMAQDLVDKISRNYIGAFLDFANKMEEIKDVL